MTRTPPRWVGAPIRRRWKVRLDDPEARKTVFRRVHGSVAAVLTNRSGDRSVGSATLRVEQLELFSWQPTVSWSISLR